jgi:hypothetical protein
MHDEQAFEYLLTNLERCPHTTIDTQVMSPFISYINVCTDKRHNLAITLAQHNTSK